MQKVFLIVILMVRKSIEEWCEVFVNLVNSGEITYVYKHILFFS